MVFFQHQLVADMFQKRRIHNTEVPTFRPVAQGFFLQKCCPNLRNAGGKHPMIVYESPPPFWERLPCLARFPVKTRYGQSRQQFLQQPGSAQRGVSPPWHESLDTKVSQPAV